MGSHPSVYASRVDDPAARSRAEALRHIEEHARGEADRIARLSRVRELVLGAQDGLLVPLGVVSGMAAASPGRSLIIVAGAAEAVAGAIAMGAGSYLASEAEERLYAGEIEQEGAEVVEHPGREVAELALILEAEGLDPDGARRVAEQLAEHPQAFLRTKVQKELGLSPDAGGAALGDALVVGASYLVAAAVPLWPYLFFGVGTALAVSVVATLAALFGLGALKGRVTRQGLARAGAQVLAIGSLSAAVGYGVGRLVSGIA